jgi:SPP1 gp7 family putative phage head morphogenesis protein
MDGERDVEFSLAQAAIGAGARPRDVARELLEHWRYPREILAKKDDDPDDRSRAGSHPIPELARSERAFYDALTEHQREAYRTVADLVDTLYRDGKGWAGVDPFALDEPIDEWKRRAFNALATKPMSAYLLGQMLTQEALGAAVARPLYPTDREAIKFLEHQTFNEVGTAFDRLKGELKTTLIQGMKDGTNPLEMARQLRATFKDNESDFALLTITENTRAEAAGRLNELKDADEEWCIVSSAHDTKTCDACKELLDGKKLKVADMIGASNYGRKRANWIPCVPLHPRCRCSVLPFSESVATIVRDKSRDIT